jgi:hypothetical protein
MPLDLTPAQRAVETHVRGFFADRPVDLFAFDDGPIQARVPGFALLRVAPEPGGGLGTSVTCGAWDAVLEGEHGLEGLEQRCDDEVIRYADTACPAVA